MNCVKRIALMVIRNILLVPFMWCKLCYYAAHVDKYPEITRYKLLKYIVKRANKGGNVTIEAYGKENIPKEGGLCFFRIIKGFMTYSQLLMPARVHFLWWQKKKWQMFHFSSRHLNV